MVATCKNCEFLEQDKAPILIFKFELVLDKLEKKSETAAAHPSAARSKQRRRPCRPHSDHGRRCFAMLTASPPPPLCPQLVPPPSTALHDYKGCTPDLSFPLFTSITFAPPSSLPPLSLPSSTSPVPALSACFPTQLTYPQAPVQCRAAPRPSCLPTQPLVLTSTAGSHLPRLPPS
jgi:hypothetical protein